MDSTDHYFFGGESALGLRQRPDSPERSIFRAININPFTTDAWVIGDSGTTALEAASREGKFRVAGHKAEQAARMFAATSREAKSNPRLWHRTSSRSLRQMGPGSTGNTDISIRNFRVAGDTPTTGSGN
jgi:hypothetical protein